MSGNNAISRKDAIKAIRKACKWDYPFASKPSREIEADAVQAVRSLQAVQPERKTGKWVHHELEYGVAYCSECCFALKINNTNYCPNCGADMRGGQDETD